MASFLEDASKIRIADEGVIKKNVNWYPLNDYFISNVCFWQSGLLSKTFTDDFNVLLIWGDAWRITTWGATLIARVRGKRVIFWTHGLYGSEGLLRRCFRLTFYKMSNHIFTYGGHAKNLFIRAGFTPENVTVIGNSIANQKSLLELASIDDKSLNDKLSRLEICFIGRLEHNKSLNTLIDLLVWYRDNRHIKIYLHFVGDGSVADDLVTYADENNIADQINFHGSKYSPVDIYECVKDCICCISPGNIGLTSITSLSLGIPIITHSEPIYQMPEFESVIEGVSGRLFVRNNLLSLVDAFDNLVEDVKVKSITVATCIGVAESFFSEESQLRRILDVICKYK
jgi:glycosyltransferase involved in cell wall biosynthesis